MVHRHGWLPHSSCVIAIAGGPEPIRLDEPVFQRVVTVPGEVPQIMDGIRRRRGLHRFEHCSKVKVRLAGYPFEFRGALIRGALMGPARENVAPNGRVLGSCGPSRRLELRQYPRRLFDLLQRINLGGECAGRCSPDYDEKILQCSRP